MRSRRTLAPTAATAALVVTGLVATGIDVAATTAAPNPVTLVVYDSFPVEGSGVNEALAEFSADTGIDVELLVAGDAGLIATKAILTAGNPEGDVLFGVDNTFLSRVVDEDVFEPYVSPALEAVPDEFTELVADGAATPVTFGDVCINYDIAWFDEAGIEPPDSLASLTADEYRDLLVVEDAAGSSPGLAFVMASIAEFGEDGWVEYWQQLRDNGVLVVDGWTEAYYEAFTAFGGGDRPIVVSYGSSPPYEVLGADEGVEEPTTAAVESTCFRQVEFAGVLRGTDAPDEARQLVDFLLGERFQSEIALGLYVYPVNHDVHLPIEFAEYATVPAEPLTLDPELIAANRDAWIDTWTETVLR